MSEYMNGKDGRSQCVAGEERYEEFTIRHGIEYIKRVQYDYRTPDGALFSCVKPTLEAARRMRNVWLAEQAAKLLADCGTLDYLVSDLMAYLETVDVTRLTASELARQWRVSH